MRIYLLVAVMCGFASVAEARKPLLMRPRSSSTSAQTNRQAAPPKPSAMTPTSAPATSTLQSDEQMTKIYGPSILVRS
jgi:hypothetical protein